MFPRGVTLKPSEKERSMNSMNSMNSTNGTNGTLQKQKRPYTTPVLTVHGTLEELTKTTDKKFGPTDGFTFEGNPITNVS